MRVYLPFDDGSSVSFDGTRFTVQRRPMGIDADLSGLGASKAEDAWRRDWEAVARALESAWRRQREIRRQNSPKRVYNNVRIKSPGAVGEN